MPDLWMLSADGAWHDLSRRNQSVLSAAERCRLTAIRRPDIARRFLLGRVLVRTVLGRYLSCAPGDVPLAVLPSGKAVLEGDPGIVFSLSHSGVFMALGVARGAALGVDIEQDSRSDQALRIVRHFFPAAERAWLETRPRKGMDALSLWTLKESIVKAQGLSLWCGLKGVQLDMRGPQIRITHLPDSAADSAANGAAAKNWTLETGRLKESLVFSVALKGGEGGSASAGRVRRLEAAGFFPAGMDEEFSD